MPNLNRRYATLATTLLMTAGIGGASAADVVRTPLPTGINFPISLAVTVPAGMDTVYVSGALPMVTNKDAPNGSVESYGDMETQTVSALTQIKAALSQLGMGMGDVVKMTVFMVADPKDNKINFPGLMAGYTKFFGTAEQPNKPARSAVQVAALVLPGALVEIEVIAAKSHDKPAKGRR